MSRFTLLLAGFASILAVSASRAALMKIDFDDQKRGTKINTQFVSKFGVTISADNFTSGHPDQAIIFDSNNHSTKTDTDEQYPWSNGNLKGKLTVKKLLIIAENLNDKNKDGLVDDPDDEGGQPSGTLKFKFKKAITLVGVDLIDIDGSSEIKADRGFISFKAGGVEKARVSFGDFVTGGNKFFDSSVKYGNRTANHLKPITAAQLGLTAGFDEVNVNFGWSSGMDALVFDDDTTFLAPEPSLMALLAPAQLGLRRRKSN